MTTVVVRFEEPRDETAVREVNDAAFESPLEGSLVEALRGSAGSLSLVATIDDRVVGHILFTSVSIETNEKVSRPLEDGGLVRYRPEFSAF